MNKQIQLGIITGAGVLALGAGLVLFPNSKSGMESTATAQGKSPLAPKMPKKGTAQAPATSVKPGQASPGEMVQMEIVRPDKLRRDPFKVDWRIPPAPPLVFEKVQPIRIASIGVVAPPPPNTEVREVPVRRVSGILRGEGVFAILEGGGDEPEIVKPGGLTKDGYRVVSITADTVKLQKKEGNLVRTQTVPLTDVDTGTAQPAAMMGGAGGRGGFPGGGFPGGGIPGGGFPGGPGGFQGGRGGPGGKGGGGGLD